MTMARHSDNAEREAATAAAAAADEDFEYTIRPIVPGDSAEQDQFWSFKMRALANPRHGSKKKIPAIAVFNDALAAGAVRACCACVLRQVSKRQLLYRPVPVPVPAPVLVAVVHWTTCLCERVGSRNVKDTTDGLTTRPTHKQPVN